MIEDPTGYLFNVWLPRVSDDVSPMGTNTSYRNNLSFLRGGMAMLTYFNAFVPRARFKVEASVAEIFWATNPGFPIPVTTTRPLQSRIARTASANASSSLTAWMVAASAARTVRPCSTRPFERAGAPARRGRARWSFSTRALDRLVMSVRADIALSRPLRQRARVR